MTMQSVAHDPQAGNVQTTAAMQQELFELRRQDSLRYYPLDQRPLYCLRHAGEIELNGDVLPFTHLYFRHALPEEIEAGKYIIAMADDGCPQILRKPRDGATIPGFVGLVTEIVRAL